MEASAYLSSGFGIRMAIRAKPHGWTPLSEMARVWSPGRLKGIQVGRDVGTPFLAATQVYDVRPIPRKWLALARTADAQSRFVTPGMILVTCSGSVGRPTVAYDTHAHTLISHDLLRVEPRNERDAGWLYAYLHAPQTRAMAAGAQYGHIIKHLEPSHLDALPVPAINDTQAADFTRRVAEIVALRNRGYRLTLEAEEHFENAIGALKVKDWGERGFSAKASATLLHGRRRFEASVHNPGVLAIRRHLAKGGREFTAVDRDYDIWLPTRFRRIPAEDGVPLVGSAELVEINPDIDKYISDDTDFGDPYRGRVHAGWLLLARSGQMYGINGTATLATHAFEDHVITDDVIRAAPKPNCALRVGYLLVALSHPRLGLPLVKSLGYGSSIPHIDPGDFAKSQVVRLGGRIEATIAELAEAAAKDRAEADVRERGLARDAESIIGAFLAA